MELISVLIFPSLSSTWQGRANGVRSLSESLLYNLQFQAFRLRANGRNNSQHCWRNNVGSCCVRVGSGVQTDATTSNNVGTCSASWEGYNP